MALSVRGEGRATLVDWPLRPEAKYRRETASAAACLACDRLSVDVRWRPPPSVAIVTHFVTQSLMSQCRERSTTSTWGSNQDTQDHNGEHGGTKGLIPGV